MTRLAMSPSFAKKSYPIKRLRSLDLTINFSASAQVIDAQRNIILI